MDWIVLDRVDSTNRYLKELARRGAPQGTVVLARTQTGGRGRLGRDFYSPVGGLYLSLLLRPDLAPGDLPLLTPLCALSVCRTIEDLFGLAPAIKWVNDLYLAGKKVCGILCERAGEAVVVGVGLNYTSPEGGFPKGLNAGALFSGPPPIPTAELAGELAKNLLEDAKRLPDAGFLAAYRRRELTLGKDITVHPVGAPPYGARAAAIDDRGRLAIETKDGTRTLDSGEVSVRF